MSITLTTVIDFALVLFFVFFTLKILHGTRGAIIIQALIAVVVILLAVYGLAKNIGFPVFTIVLEYLFRTLPILVVIAFSSEIRRTLAKFGGHKIFINGKKMHSRRTVEEVLDAVRIMSDTKTGALIVFEQTIGLKNIRESAISLSARVDSKLIQSIFYPNSPLHDGAVIINGDSIEAARAFLPLTKQLKYTNSDTIGTRHRAAIGITEETDAIAIVVSEETGLISLTERNNIFRGLTIDELDKRLEKCLHQDRTEKETLN